MSDLPPVPPHIVRVTAPLLLGGLFNWFLFGVLLVQVYVYSYNFPDDRKRVKLLVYGIFLLEAVQSVLRGADLFYWLASGYGNLEHLLDPFATPLDGPILESLVSTIVRFFYAYRIWIITNKRSWWICALICLFSSVNLVAGLTGGIYTRLHQRFAIGRHLQNIAITWMVGDVTADLLVTSAMVYHIKKIRKESYCSNSLRDHALVKIVRLTIETNLLTTIMALLSLLLVLIYPIYNWYTCPAAILGNLYSNSLLVSLNSRISIRDERERNTRLSTQPQPMAVVITSHYTSTVTPTDISLKELEQPEVPYKSPERMEI